MNKTAKRTQFALFILNMLLKPIRVFRFSFSNFVFVQVGKFIQLVSTFIGGFIIAFIKGWLLTLVMLSSIPLLVIAGGAMSLFLSKMATRGQNAYAKAATVVEQTIGSIRTVCHIGQN